MTISFAGHSLVPLSEKVEKITKEQIRRIIAGEERVTCYLGGYGDFDEICARACRKLKGEREGIDLIYVTPYISLSEQEKIKSMQL